MRAVPLSVYVILLDIYLVLAQFNFINGKNVHNRVTAQRGEEIFEVPLHFLHVNLGKVHYLIRAILVASINFIAPLSKPHVLDQADWCICNALDLYLVYAVRILDTIKAVVTGDFCHLPQSL